MSTRIESLQELATREWAKDMAKKEKEIPALADANIAERRSTLQGQLDELDRQRQVIEQKLAILEQEKLDDVANRKRGHNERVVRTMEKYLPGHLYERSCNKCQGMETKRIDSLWKLCSVKGCDFYKVCSFCDLDSYVPKDPQLGKFDNDADIKEIC